MVVTERTRWPNAERVVKDMLAAMKVDGVPVKRVGRETAPGDQFEAPCVRAERTGGAVNRDFTADFPVIEFACFGVNYDQAQDMSATIAEVMESMVGELVGPPGEQTVLDLAQQDTGPQRPQWGANARRDITRWRLSWRPLIAD